jgi:hypothetical protein
VARPLADYQMEDLIGRGPVNGKYRKRRSDLKVGRILINSGIDLFAWRRASPRLCG